MNDDRGTSPDQPTPSSEGSDSPRALPPIDPDPPLVSLKGTPPALASPEPEWTVFPPSPPQAPIVRGNAHSYGGALSPASPVPASAAPPDGFFARHKWKLVLGSGVVLVVVAIGLLLLTRGDGGRRAAEAVITRSTPDVTRVVAAMNDASDLNDLETAGREANRGLSTLGQESAGLTDIDDREIRQPVEELLRAETAFLDRVRELEEVAAKPVRLRRRWDAARSSIDATRGRLATATAAVKATNLGTNSALLPESRDIDSALSNADEIVEKALR